MTAAVCAVASASPALAQEKTFNIPAQSVSSGLPELARQADVQILLSEAASRGKSIKAVRGTMTVEEALRRALAGTGLGVTSSDGRTFIVAPDRTKLSAADDAGGSDIVVTGSLVRGAITASPTIVTSQQSIRDSGRATLAEAIRDIPQNFGGGQNPGIGFNVPESSGADSGGSGSAVNLRGLGSDATLTLLNGRRIAYNGGLQAVDVSLIPLGAVDRLEVVAEGSSALYGSDAVGGVVNIILKPDMDHIETRMRLGGSTDGGNFQQQYSVTGGTRWGSGGFIAALEYNRASPIEFSDRDYTRTVSPGLRLFPSINNRNALFSLHQELNETISFKLDSLYNYRRSKFIYSYNATGDRSISRATRSSSDRAYTIAPTVQFTLGDWQAFALATYSRDKVIIDLDFLTGTTPSGNSHADYDNVTKSAEVSANGPLFALLGGSAKLAVGAGYSRVLLDSFRGVGNATNFGHTRNSHYAFGEFVAPLASPELDIKGLYRLQVSAALRYENYQDTGSIATPKLGIVYAPIDALDIKGSWGKSFRAPTLYQRYSALNALARRPSVLGGPGYPADSFVLYTQGRSEDLKPERATTWSITADLHPPSIPGLTFTIDYFNVRYINRIVTPILLTANALSDPAYSAYVTLSPSAAQIADIIASATSFSNNTGADFDPAKVVAIVDNSNVNAGRQWANGFDALLAYSFDISAGQTVSLTGNVSYLDSRRRISADQPEAQLAGIIFNPPHWRGRATLGWSNEHLSIQGAASHNGSLSDARRTPATRVKSQTTFDMTARYSVPDDIGGLLKGLSLGVTAQNIFNVAPPRITSNAVYEQPYDSTNYQPIGRFVAIDITKRW